MTGSIEFLFVVNRFATHRVMQKSYVAFLSLESLFILFVRSLTFVLPYFPTGTMEREDEEGQVATAMTMARMLSAIPLSAMGPSKIMIFDIHSLQVILPSYFYCSALLFIL